MNDDAIFEKIEAWLSGELPEVEARAFEAEIAADFGLAMEVERHRRGREALERLAEQALQADMALWRESLDEIPAPPTNVLSPEEIKHWPKWTLGGLFVLLVGGALYWLWPSKDVQPGSVPVEENIPVQIKPDVPVVNRPEDEQANEIKDGKQGAENNSAPLVAMATSNLGDLQGAILQQYSQTMGDDDEENPFFTAGVKAFKGNDLKVAKRDLLQVIKTDPFFPSAQEILAYIYFREKNYPKAVKSYESFASQSADPAADWRLLQFYLSDYPNHKAEFWKKLEEIADPEKHHQFKKEADNLKRELDKMRIN